MINYIRLIIGLFFVFGLFLLIYGKKKDLLPTLKYINLIILWHFFMAICLLYGAFT